MYQSLRGYTAGFLQTATLDSGDSYNFGCGCMLIAPDVPTTTNYFYEEETNAPKGVKLMRYRMSDPGMILSAYMTRPLQGFFNFDVFMTPEV